MTLNSLMFAAPGAGLVILALRYTTGLPGWAALLIGIAAAAVIVGIAAILDSRAEDRRLQVLHDVADLENDADLEPKTERG